MSELVLSISEQLLEKETLRINRKMKAMNGKLSVLKWRDKDTLQYVYYIPSFELTGYGETEKRLLKY